MLDDTLALTAHERGDAPTPAVATLVLFVGPACRPDAASGRLLAREGMRCVWLPDVEQAFAAARQAHFDALVLDAGALDGRDGSTLPRLRATLGCPVLVRAEQVDEVEEIVALERGADAWLAAPLAPRRLRAHLGALMRGRSHPPPAEASAGLAPQEEEPSGWRIDRVANRLRCGPLSIGLTEVQAAFVQCLLEAEGRIVPRERLLAALPLARGMHQRNADVYVHRLRRRLRDAGATDLSIEAIRGRGYVLHTA